jgi:hypothetical protein
MHKVMKGSQTRPAQPRRQRIASVAKVVIPLFFVFFFTVGLTAMSASADDGPTPTDAEVTPLQLQQSEQLTAELTEPDATEDLPRSDLGREEAVELTESVFAPLLDAAAGPFQDLDVEKYLSDTAAVVSATPPPDALLAVGGGENADLQRLSSDPGAQSTVLLESTIPLRTEESNGVKVPLDLELERVGDHLSPKAPLVELEIPQELGDGIALPESGIRISLANAPKQVTPSVTEDGVAIYPNVGQDLDFSAISTPTGVETLTTLRSPAAPTQHTMILDLPSGAELRQAGEGAEVIQGEQTLLLVPDPFGVDADGDDVPVELSVSGNALTVTAEPDGDAAYPIMVDPMFEDYDWYSAECTTAMAAAWTQNRTGNWGIYPSGGVCGKSLQVRSQPNHDAWEQASWTYSVPRLKLEQISGRTTTSYIASMLIWHVGLTNWGSGSSASPYLFAGIWGGQNWAGKPGQQPAVWALGGNASETSMNPGYGVTIENGEWGLRDKDAKVAFGLGMESTTSSSTSNGRIGNLGAAKVEVADETPPGIANPSFSPWADQTATASLSATAEDSGLGVKKIRFEPPWGITTAVSPICVGNAAYPCPLKWTGSIAGSVIPPSTLPQGYNYVPISAEDLLGNKSATPAKAVLQVDHMSPSLKLSGSLTEQGAIGAKGSEYKLHYDAYDGEATAASAQSPFGTMGAGKLTYPFGVVLDSAGNRYVLDLGTSRVQKYSPTGEFLSQFGSLGSGAGMLKAPQGIAMDPSGFIGVADTNNNRLVRFTTAGTFVAAIGKDVNKSKVEAGGTEAQRNLCTASSGDVCQAGVAGSATGQLSAPSSLAFSAGGNIYVVDTGNNRVQKLTTEGGYLAKFGSSGSGAAQLSSPHGIGVDYNGAIWVGDTGNHRVQVWSSTFAYNGQIGAYGTGNGQLREPWAVVPLPTGDALVLDANNNRIQQFHWNGSFVRAFGSTGSASNQLSAPRGMAVSADGTVHVADMFNSRVTEWKHGVFDPQSGIRKAEVKVDGVLVEPAFTQGCEVASCEAHRDWNMKANSLAAGNHTLEVKVTDGVGRATSKTVNFSTVKDSTAPQVTGNGAFYNAPDGWLDQQTYAYNATATDVGGHGVVSLTLKVDDKVIASSSQACPGGDCQRSITGSLNLMTYQGGAHPAELIAVDGGGLIYRKKWTINVNPAGTISGTEATRTIDASDETANSIVVAPTDEVFAPELIAAGDNPGLKVEGEKVVSTGTNDLIEMTTDPADGYTIHTPEDTFEVTPIVGSQTGDLVVAEGVAGVVPNIRSEVDNVVRPEYNGLLNFQSIRSPASPEEFAWTIKVWPGQELVSASAQHAELLYPDGTTAMLISAEAAHDATGKAVPTSLRVQGSVVTLTVGHRSAPFIYPVAAGQAFEVGASSVTVRPPPPPPPAQQQEEEAEEGPQPPYEAPAPNADPRDHPRWTLRRKPGPRWVTPAPTFNRQTGDSIHAFFGEDYSAAGEDKWRVWVTGQYIKKQFTSFTWTIQRKGLPNCQGTIGKGLGGIPYIPGGQIDNKGWFGPEIVERKSGAHLGIYCQYRYKSYPGPELEPEVFCRAIQAWAYPSGDVKQVKRSWDYGNDGIDFCPNFPSGSIVF